MPISPQDVTFRTISVKQAVILFIYLFMITCSISRIMYWFKGSAKNGENKKKTQHYSKEIYEQFKGERDFNPPCRLHLMSSAPLYFND